MGTWIEMEVDEKEVAHLDTPISAPAENQAIRAVFPEGFWDKNYSQEFDFVSNQRRAQRVIKDFLESVKGGWEANQHPNPLAEMVRDALAPTEESNPSKRLDFALTWAKEFEALYNLGVKLQQEGKHPKITISL